MKNNIPGFLVIVLGTLMMIGGYELGCINIKSYQKSVQELTQELVTERTLNAKLQVQVYGYKKCLEKQYCIKNAWYECSLESLTEEII